MDELSFISFHLSPVVTSLRHTAAGLREDRLYHTLTPHIKYRTDRRWGRLHTC